MAASTAADREVSEVNCFVMCDLVWYMPVRCARSFACDAGIHMFQIYEATVIPMNDDPDSPLCRRRDKIHRFASIFTLNV